MNIFKKDSLYKKCIILSVLFVVSIYQSYSLSTSWLQPQKDNGQIHQFEKQQSIDSKTTYLLIENYDGEELKFNATKGLIVYHNGQFLRKYNKSGYVSLKKNELANQKTKIHYLTFYHPDKQLPQEVKHASTKQAKSEEAKKQNLYKKRQAAQNVEYKWLVIIAFMIAFVLVKRYLPTVFYTLLSKIQLIQKEDSGSKNYDVVLFFVSSIYITILIAFLFSYNSQVSYTHQSFSFWLMVSLLFLFIKALITVIISTLYGLHIHKNMIITYSKTLVFVVSAYSLFYIITTHKLVVLESMSLKIIVLLLFIAMGIQFRAILNYLRFHKLYLFSYICTAEIIPFLISAKYLLSY